MAHTRPLLLASLLILACAMGACRDRVRERQTACAERLEVGCLDCRARYAAGEGVADCDCYVPDVELILDAPECESAWRDLLESGVEPPWDESTWPTCYSIGWEICRSPEIPNL